MEDLFTTYKLFISISVYLRHVSLVGHAGFTFRGDAELTTGKSKLHWLGLMAFLGLSGYVFCISTL